MKIRQVLLGVFTLVVLVVVNGLVIQKELLLKNGREILLELAPVDPRSLIQGDYMALRYAISEQIERASPARDGFAIVRLDANNVATFVGIYQPGMALGPDETLLRFRERGEGVYIGPESFFFQEGDAEYYREAEYGALRVGNNGSVVLVGLRGKELEPLGPP